MHSKKEKGRDNEKEGKVDCKERRTGGRKKKRSINKNASVKDTPFHSKICPSSAKAVYTQESF